MQLLDVLLNHLGQNLIGLFKFVFVTGRKCLRNEYIFSGIRIRIVRVEHADYNLDPLDVVLPFIRWIGKLI